MNDKLLKVKRELAWYKKGLIDTVAGEGGRKPKEVKEEIEEEFNEYYTSKYESP